jgi:hypothetical protein
VDLDNFVTVRRSVRSETPNIGGSHTHSRQGPREKITKSHVTSQSHKDMVPLATLLEERKQKQAWRQRALNAEAALKKQQSLPGDILDGINGEGK